jgi:ribonuclease D
VRVISTAEGALELARDLSRASRIALDLESDGIFAYRARICLMQIAYDGEVAIVDTMGGEKITAPLAELLGEKGPIKIVHDIAFDARLLAERGIEIGNVHDTAMAARMLGQQQAGLANVLNATLGVTVSKAMQHHDWRIRPLTDEMLAYLASDVAHLERLDDALFTQVRARGIEDEVLCETRHRIATAVTSARTPDTRPAYLRLKGIEKASTPELAIARRLAEVREREAERRDVPPHRVLAAEALLAIARSRPASTAQLARVRGGSLTGELARDVLRAVEAGLADGAVPEEERASLRRPRLAPEIAKTRRARETRLTAWRKGEAKARGVDEQVVLPGHCLKDVAELDDVSELASVAGIGAFRVARYGEAIARAWRGDGGEADAEAEVAT